jgi:hypothetical protein
LIKEISDGDSTGNPGHADDGDKDHLVMTSSRKNDGATGYGKDAARKSQTPDFPSPLGNPATPAGFPLSHSPRRLRESIEIRIFYHYEKRGHF